MPMEMNIWLTETEIKTQWFIMTWLKISVCAWVIRLQISEHHQSLIVRGIKKVRQTEKHE
ncbi:hypothetical protein APT80_10115 [Klebsiella pneumoniae]|nr:hypothetical protein AB187_00480 [Klebsiella pneumoniae]AKR86848.1 hypothetical protein H218_28575 [Klebsiella pneumoniae DMC1097]KEF64524.1 hypothetical protein Y972_27250 [Klebsiella pneumoniae UHKPC45]KLA43237.1 hypothetical protein WB36_00770 [Klebsiella pneumoniae subsp. pneumoniae]KSX20088.1 hypothetical protein APT80_10115 [Klebsiella pneumoniae]